VKLSFYSFLDCIGVTGRTYTSVDTFQPTYIFLHNIRNFLFLPFFCTPDQSVLISVTPANQPPSSYGSEWGFVSHITGGHCAEQSIPSVTIRGDVAAN
jgi:hypothetical protein